MKPNVTISLFCFTIDINHKGQLHAIEMMTLAWGLNEKLVAKPGNTAYTVYIDTTVWSCQK